MDNRDLLNQLELFQKILKYLDTSGNLAIIKAHCEKYKKCGNKIFIFKLLIDTLDLCETDAYLGNLVLQQTQIATSFFNQLVYKVVQVLDLLPENVCLSQISVILRLSTLPTLTQINTIEDVRCLSKGNSTGVFCKLRGIVTGLSAVSKYTQSTRYYCPDKDCFGYHGNNFIRIHTAGASEAQTVRKDFKCTYCFSTLTEEKSSRILSERLVAEVVPSSFCIQVHQKHTCRSQAVPVYIRDDLTKLVDIGECYDIIGFPKTDIQDDKVMLTIEANNILKVRSDISTRALLQQIPRSILELYKDRKSSPWSFTLTLAYIFAGEITPAGTYFNLKLALLLSLMSRLDTKTKSLHILAVGPDTEMLSRLLQFAQTLSETSTNLTAGHSLSGHVTTDKYNSAKYFVEGGVLHLSQRGVCSVGDVNRLKRSTQQQLHTAMSGHKIVTDVGSKFTGGLPHYMEQPLRSRVWAYSDSTSSRRSTQQGEELFVPSKTGDVSMPLLESFSLVCFTSHGELLGSEDMDLDVMHMTLLAAMDCGEDQQCPLSALDIHQFVRFASKLRPKFSKESETLIHSYYLSSRKSRSTAGSTDVPVNADQTILSLAYSHAKLALRTEVTIHDALMAIRIYEQYLTLRFGYSTLCVQPVLHVPADSLGDFLGPGNDHQMKQFHTNLLRYCSLASGMEE